MKKTVVLPLLAWLLFLVVPETVQAQTTNYVLGTTALLVGPSVGSNSVVLAITPATAIWTATTNAAWLHLSPANQSGTGSTNLVFSFDPNLGGTRSGTITIGDQVLTVTQAGSTYLQAGVVATLVSSGINQPQTVAVDAAGNVFIADTWNDAIKKWTATNNSVTTIVSLSPQKEFAIAAALDGVGNIYIIAYGNIFTDPGKFYKWTAANSNLTTLLSSGLNIPSGVAVDSAGNAYIDDSGHQAIKKWTASNSNVTAVVSSGLNGPIGVAVDIADNVYICDTDNNVIKEWKVVNSNVTTLGSLGLTNYYPEGVAVDGSGNVYIGGNSENAVLKWTAATSNLTTLVSSGLNAPTGVAVDSVGNVYFADTENSEIKEQPYAFVDPSPKSEGPLAGSDALSPVLPPTENLLPPFAPTSDQTWLTVTGITNGVVSFTFTANTGPARTAHITLLGQNIPITQRAIGTSPTLTGLQMLSSGVFQFSFTNIPSASFTILSATNLSLPLSNWTVVGNPVEAPSGTYQFTSQPTTNDAQRFYGVVSP